MQDGRETKKEIVWLGGGRQAPTQPSFKGGGPYEYLFNVKSG